MSKRSLVAPHGGELVNRCVSAGGGPDGLACTIQLTERQRCDLEMIAQGAMSPLTGFMGQADYNSVCDRLRLATGTAWPIPIT